VESGSANRPVVRRFSSKEEKRRVVASVIDPRKLDYEWIGIENHLNVFHENREPLSEDVACGIAAYLNSSVVEKYFRRFNGHTQVNATDLKNIPYPSKDALIDLGRWAKFQPRVDEAAIDERLNRLV
jgi:hypothetical protein